MKRRILTVLIFLLLGEVLNVAVAWGCLYFESAVRGMPHQPFGITRDYGGILMVGFPMRSMHWPSYYGNLPDSIIWPGFAINTLFYAAILWLLFALQGALRRWRRIKRGLCPACAYPVGTSDLCTECGNKLNITSKIARERMGLPPPATPAAERTT